MKTIASLNGVEFLKAVNRSRHAAEKFIKTTGVVGIWKKMPAHIPEKPTEDMDDETKERIEQQRIAAVKAQMKRNLSEILDTVLDTHAEETMKFIMALCVVEDGAPEPDGIELMMAALDIISDDRVLDFFGKLMKSGLISMGT